MASRLNYTDAAYAAILRALEAATAFVPRDQHCGLTTVLAIGKRGFRGTVRRNVHTRRSGNRVHTVAGVELTMVGLRDMRADIIARDGEIPTYLAKRLEPAAPALTASGRPGYRSILNDLDPVLVLGCGRDDDIPF